MDKDWDRREYPRSNKMERREYRRVIVSLETAVSAGKRVQVSGWTRDLSVKGVYVLCNDRLPIGTYCRCRIALGDILQGAPLVEVEGTVVRTDDTGLAVQFNDSAIECLRKIGEYFGLRTS